MSKDDYVPDRGHVIWMDFDPQLGREQAGRRPALVLSPASYNDNTQLALICPITTQVKGFRFEVPVPDGLPVTGVILSDHIKSLDWWHRHAEYACKVPDSVVAEVRARILAILR